MPNKVGFEYFGAVGGAPLLVIVRMFVALLQTMVVMDGIAVKRKPDIKLDMKNASIIVQPPSVPSTHKLCSTSTTATIDRIAVKRKPLANGKTCHVDMKHALAIVPDPLRWAPYHHHRPPRATTQRPVLQVGYGTGFGGKRPYEVTSFAKR